MKVRITKIRPECWWDIGKVGKVLDVVDAGDYYAYHPLCGTGTLLHKEDCQLVLDHKVFDPIYERCDKDTGRDMVNFATGFYFSTYVTEYSTELRDQYIDGIDYHKLSRALMAAYASGEIRDAGPYMQPLNIRKHKDDAIDAISRIPEFITTHMGVDWAKSDDWYKLDPTSFDKLVDDPFEFYSEMEEANKRLYTHLFRLPLTIEKIRLVAVALYVSGILRKGGAMPDVCPECGKAL